VRTAFLVIAVATFALAAGLAWARPAVAETVKWQRTYDGRLRSSDGFTSVVTAGDGGAYAAGYTAVSFVNRSDMLLVRYAADGSRSWVRRWNGPRSGSDQCWDLARDGQGGLYLVGRTAGRGGDAAILRYASDGRLIWSRRFDAGTSWQDDARFVRTVDHDGVFVVVESWSGTAYRTRVLRYSQAGERVWMKALAPGARVSGATTDADGNLYLSGWAASAVGSAARLDSFSPGGSLRWTVRLPGDAAFTRATAVADRRSGIVWTMDSSTAAAELGHGSVSASPYTPFARQWNGDPGLTPPYELADVSGTRDGGAVAVGRTRSGTLDAGFVVRFSATGAVASSIAWSDPAGCSGDLVATSSDGSAWIAGRTGPVFSVLHYLPGSGLVWRLDYDGRPASRALALRATSDGGAYAVGWERAAGGGADAVILRLAP
jgi:hypothetical protein